MRRTKTPHSAVVLIPPENLWAPIQAIRQVQDSHFRRWMPHVTLLFPFYTADTYDEVANDLEAAAADVMSFPIRLARFDYFAGPKTAWLEPEPVDAVKKLQASLQSRFPDCDDVARFPGGFRPHLSVGQGPASLIGQLQAGWKPLEFEAASVALIRRDGPEDPFRVHRSVKLS